MSLADDIQEEKSGGRPWLFLIAALIAASAFIFIAINSFDQQVYYFTVEEAAAAPNEVGNEQFRLKGNVEPGSHMIREGTLDEHRFVLEENGASMAVSFKGPLPDTFTDEAEVVALGAMNDEGVFVAEEVSAKCPSRYEGGAPTAEE
jgi:cytochrome c-type biogenesis protein CcmE